MILKLKCQLLSTKCVNIWYFPCRLVSKLVIAFYIQACTAEVHDISLIYMRSKRRRPVNIFFYRFNCLCFFGELFRFNCFYWFMFFFYDKMPCLNEEIRLIKSNLKSMFQFPSSNLQPCITELIIDLIAYIRYSDGCNV